MTQRHQQARADLHEWMALHPENFYASAHQLQRLLERLLGEPGLRSRQEHLQAGEGARLGEGRPGQQQEDDPRQAGSQVTLFLES